MTQTDQQTLFLAMIETHGAASVARAIGYSQSAVSQAKNDKYQGDLTNLLTRVEEVYGSTRHFCPVFGEEISLGRCAEERRKLPRYTNPVARLLTQTCPTCERGGGQ
ncbi:MAG: hypothetical protein AB7D06_17060 [Pedobacter sp.]